MAYRSLINDGESNGLFLNWRFPRRVAFPVFANLEGRPFMAHHSFCLVENDGEVGTCFMVSEFPRLSRRKVHHGPS